MDDRWGVLLSHDCAGRYEYVKDIFHLLHVFRCSCGFDRAIQGSQVKARRLGRFKAVIERELSMEPVAELLNVRQWGVDSLDALRAGCMMVWDERRSGLDIPPTQ